MIKIRVFTGCLFVFFMWFGLLRASYQRFWNDESYSLVSSIMGKSYDQIIFSNMGTVEGNNSPLFYLLQKLQCDLFAFHVPSAWAQSHWGSEDVFAQVFLRIQPVLCIALSLAALFYYFALRYSMSVGFYSVMVALSSFMLWAHWTESRPYALWFMLTTAQALLLLELLRGAQVRRLVWGCLALVHCLLALTTTIAILQVVMSAVLLWSFNYRRWQQHIGVTVLPVAICLYYYITFATRIKFNYYFVDGPLALISANIPKDRFLIIFIFALFYGVRRWRSKGPTPITVEGKYFIFMALMLIAYAAILAQFKYLEMIHGPKGFQVPARYFMALTPIGIVGTTIFSAWLLHAAESKVMRAIVIMGLGVFLVFRMYKVSTFFSWGTPY